MARSVFFSFHFARDSWRVGQVRNCNVIQANPKNTFYKDKADWEKVKRQGDQAIKNWIDNQLSGTSVTVVLIGKETHTRRWVKYEIDKSIELGHALIGINITQIKNQYGEVEPDANPISPLPSKYPVYAWRKQNGAENLAKWIEAARS